MAKLSTTYSALAHSLQRKKTHNKDKDMEPLELFDSIMTLDEEGKDATELVSELQR